MRSLKLPLGQIQADYGLLRLRRATCDGVSPSGKARDFDSRTRRFEPCHPSMYDPLAQLAEHLTFNQGVWSSNLQWVTFPCFRRVCSAGVAEWQTRQT